MDSIHLPRPGWSGQMVRIATLVIGLTAAVLFVFSVSELPRQQREAAGWVAHTLQVLSASSVMQTELITVISQGRAFIVDRSVESRLHFDEAIVQLDGAVTALRALTADNVRQQINLDRLAPLVAARIASIRSIMDALAEGHEAEARQALGRHNGRAISAQIDTITRAVEAEEQRLLDIRERDAERAVRRTTLGLVACGTVLVVSLCIQVIVLRSRASGRRHLAELSRLNAVLERRVAERTAELAASVVRQRAYFDNAPVGMVVSRVADGRFELEDINPAAEAIYGFPREPMLGRAMRDIWPENVAAHAQPFLMACVTSRATIQYDVTREYQGTMRALDVQLTPLLDPAGEANYVLACIRDRTVQRELARHIEAKAESEREAARQSAIATEQMERRRELETANAQLDRLAGHLARARDAADRANLAKSQFMASMSHELRTPLNGILGYAQLLRLEGGLSTGQDGRVDAMLRSGRHLLELVNNVLDVSQIEAGRIDVVITEVDVLSVCRAALELVGPGASERALTMSLTAGEGLPPVLADAAKLRQVLVNLLGNAIKFTPAGSIALRVRCLPATVDLPSMLRVEVADTGPGVPAAKRAHLFQMFQRLDAANGPLEGTGLGLAISRKLIELMRGQIGFAENPTGGSVFWLELPAGAVAGVARPGEIPPPASPARVRLRVLIVDDVAMNRDVASALLRTDGHLPICVASGQAAVRAALAEDFDVILMDVRMPDMDGMEATRLIRAYPGPRAGVPIVALTANAFLDQVEECRQAGMDAHVVKPFDHATLLDTMRRVAGTRHLALAEAAATDR